MEPGRLNAQAPELRTKLWIGGDGDRMDRPLQLADLGSGAKVLFAFQHWCPGCHSRGFPALRRLYDALSPHGVGFAAIQTVFEGEAVNTFDKLRLNQSSYDLPIPFGHDVATPPDPLPAFMRDYQTGGTPWFTVIDTKGRVAFAGFQIDADRMLEALSPAGAARRTPDPALAPRAGG